MIEVEIRGELTAKQAESLKKRLAREGKHVRRQEREMILLRGYPGYDKDPTKRENDIRIRRTDGKTELMLKRKVSDGNVGRREYSLPIEGDHFETAKTIAVAFGCTEGLWIHRYSDMYERDGVEWVVVEAPDRSGMIVKRYYEAELLVESKQDIPHARRQLMAAAKQLDMPVLKTDEAMRGFIYELDRTVNVEISLND